MINHWFINSINEHLTLGSCLLWVSLLRNILLVDRNWDEVVLGSYFMAQGIELRTLYLGYTAEPHLCLQDVLHFSWAGPAITEYICLPNTASLYSKKKKEKDWKSKKISVFLSYYHFSTFIFTLLKYIDKILFPVQSWELGLEKKTTDRPIIKPKKVFSE